MGFQAAPSSSFLSPLVCHTYPNLSPSQLSSLRPFLLPHKHVNSFKPHIPCLNSAKFLKARTRATLDEKEKEPLLVQEQEASTGPKTRKIPAEEVLSAFSVIEKAKLNPSAFLETLGGPDSPGRTCVLIFTAEKQLKNGRYFPLTAVQRFDAAISSLISSQCD
ncbi:hypothetical protein QQP08_010110 [Theobroma cacao]|nr:hypothetical protein QQP08_010110 [Theobroma cacao]